jgi:putative ABC transport system substrate-binding protein
MRRRELLKLAGAGALALPFAAAAQQPGRTYRIALLAPFVLSEGDTPRINPLFDELNKAGFVDGGNLHIDRRGLGTPIANLSAVAAALVETAPDALAAWGPDAARAAQRATGSIPIVALTDDPVESGLVASMAHPGGNLTGVGIFASRLDAKRLEVLHELLPAATRIGIMIDALQQLGRENVAAVGRDLGLHLVAEVVHDAAAVGRSIEALAAAKVEALNVLASARFYGARQLIIERTRALGLPTIYWWAELAREGGLIGFGPSNEETNRLHGRQLVRVLNGTPPAQLPILQPTRFLLAINLKTAKALNVAVPPSLLLREPTR